MFNDLRAEGVEKTEDRLGGFSALDTDAYVASIKVVYGSVAASGAKAVNFIGTVNGQEYRETIYVSSGTDKGGKSYYEKDGKKHYLPGYIIANDICLIVAGKDLPDMAVEEKVVLLYDFDAKKELPKSVPVLTELTNQSVGLAIAKILKNKAKKGADNKYVDTAETQEINEISKAFDIGSNFTVVEAREGLPEPKYMPAWLERNKGQTRDERTIKDGQAGSTAAPTGAPQASGAAPRTSLFGPKT